VHAVYEIVADAGIAAITSPIAKRKIRFVPIILQQSELAMFRFATWYGNGPDYLLSHTVGLRCSRLNPASSKTHPSAGIEQVAKKSGEGR
jgi:hypothetical protein